MRLLCGGQNCLFVQRFYCVHGKEVGVYALFRQLPHRLTGVKQQRTACNDCNVLAVGKFVRLHGVELIVGIEKTFRLLAHHANVHASVVLRYERQRFGNLHVVHDVHDHNVGKGTHHCHVFETHVCASVACSGDARVPTDNFYVELRVTDGNGNLVENSA